MVVKMGKNDKNIEELVEQLDFLRVQLAESRIRLDGEPLSVSYTDSRGNTRTKTNPAYEAHASMLRTYITALDALRRADGDKQTKQPQLVKFQKFADSMRKVSAD